jgi:hypothetical protein
VTMIERGPTVRAGVAFRECAEDPVVWLGQGEQGPVEVAQLTVNPGHALLALG